MPTPRKPPRDFSRYGTIEAVNVVLIPAMAVFLAPPRDGIDAAILIAAILPTAALLIVGAVYWRALSNRLSGDRRLLQRWLPVADRAERPIVVMLLVAVAGCAAGLVLRSLSGPVIAALVLTLLGVLEYVNYYHVQMQHFDNWTDFKKLVTTGRLRAAHSARDLAAYRQSQIRQPHASTSVGAPGPT